MTDEILVNATPMETRVAMVDNGQLQEVIIERSENRGLVGNIYQGRVVRVLPGMQAAFIDIGLEKAAFIHAADIDKSAGEVRDIQKLIKQGDCITVQITKDPIGTKGAKVTAFLSISARYLVYMPDIDQLGISQRIDDEAERERLKSLVNNIHAQQFADMHGSFIVRTAAEQVHAEEIVNDIALLQKLWHALSQPAQSVPAIVHEDLSLSLRVLRDYLRERVDKIKVDSRETIQKMESFCDSFMPDKKSLLEWYPGGRPIFELHSVEQEIKNALARKVMLKSGGYIVFDQTEAMTTVDVNTGGFVGHRNQEETLFKTNLEAAKSIAHQLRLRNLGGIIIVDFIDMQDNEHKSQVHRTLENALAVDLTRTSISGVTELGLVQIVRKRTRESLEQTLCDPCHVCHGTGSVKSAETVCYEIFRAIIREARAYDHDAYLVLAAQSIVDRLMEEESANVAELEGFLNKSLQFQVEPLYTQEQFEVILL